MMTPAFVRSMATYYTLMNRAAYDAAGRLDHPTRRADRWAFWRSIHEAVAISPTGTRCAVRPAMDERLEAWAATVRQDWLDGELT